VKLSPIEATASKCSWTVDIHAAPGAQNKNDHSGTPANECHFWEGNNREAAVRILRTIVLEIHNKVNIVGLSLMNEPSNNNQLQGWYESTITSVRGALSDRAERGPPPDDFPIFIDSAWDPNWYSQIVGKRDDFVVMDHHLYRCFTDQDKRLSGEQQAADIRGRTKDELKKYHANAHGNLIIGEWSAALSPEGMPHGANAGEQDRQRRVFVQAQREVYNENCAGHFFWTYKKESGWDAGWSSRDASTAAILPEWVGGPRGPFNRVDEDGRESLLKEAIGKFISWAMKLRIGTHQRRDCFLVAFTQSDISITGPSTTVSTMNSGASRKASAKAGRMRVSSSLAVRPNSAIGIDGCSTGQKNMKPRRARVEMSGNTVMDSNKDMIMAQQHANPLRSRAGSSCSQRMYLVSCYFCPENPIDEYKMRDKGLSMQCSVTCEGA